MTSPTDFFCEKAPSMGWLLGGRGERRLPVEWDREPPLDGGNTPLAVGMTAGAWGMEPGQTCCARPRRRRGA